MIFEYLNPFAPQRGILAAKNRHQVPGRDPRGETPFSSAANSSLGWCLGQFLSALFQINYLFAKYIRTAKLGTVFSCPNSQRLMTWGGVLVKGVGGNTKPAERVYIITQSEAVTRRGTGLKDESLNFYLRPTRMAWFKLPCVPVPGQISQLTNGNGRNFDASCGPSAGWITTQPTSSPPGPEIKNVKSLLPVIRVIEQEPTLSKRQHKPQSHSRRPHPAWMSTG